MQTRLTLFVAILLISIAAACDAAPDSAGDDSGQTTTLEKAEVVRVVDSDTIIVVLAGQEERLRYIGIDAPESVTPDQPVECFGPEAHDANAGFVDDRTVFLEADVENRDRFGRLLRYVYISEADGNLLMVNEALVAGGFAEARTYPPNELHQDELAAAEDRAFDAAAGLWGAC